MGMVLHPENKDGLVATIWIGANTEMSIHAFPEMTPPLVEMRIQGEVVNLTVELAKQIGDGLWHAANAAAPRLS